MIQNLEIHNYQSHKNTELTFVPGVNLISGSTDSGKSAIMRALRWCITNLPRGDGFRSHWGGETIVAIDVDDTQIARFKDKENIYYLGDTDFRAFGNEVPEEIREALNIDENVNIQKQLDNPYLISESAGYVAQHFNRMAQLEKIDLGLKNTQSLIRNTEATIKSTEQTKEEKVEELKSYAYLPTVEDMLLALENKQEEIQQKKAEKLRLSELVQQYKEATDNLKEAKKTTVGEASVTALLSKNSLHEEKARIFNNLLELSGTLSDRAESIKKGKLFIQPEKAVLTLLEKGKEIQAKAGIFDVNCDTLTDYKETLTTLEEERTEVTKLEKEYITEMPVVCPLCGNGNCKH